MIQRSLAAISLLALSAIACHPAPPQRQVYGFSTFGGAAAAAAGGSSGSSTPPAYDWARTQWAAMTTVQPALTACDYIKLGQDPLGTSATGVANEVTVEGGGRSQISGSFLNFGVMVTAKPKTGAWAVAFRAKFSAPVGGNIYIGGLVNASHSLSIAAGAIGSSSLTKYVLHPPPTADVISTVNVDAAYHDFRIHADTTNFTFYIDGALQAGSAPQSAYTSDEAVYPMILNTGASSAALIQKFAYCVVQQ
jgi:hypothetical protein